MNQQTVRRRSFDDVLVALVQRFGPAWAVRWFERPDARRYVRFLLVGGVNALFGCGVFCGLLYAGLHYAFAGLIATVLGVTFNFFTTGTLVFDTSDPRRMFAFVAAYAVNYGVSVALLRVAELLGWNLYVSYVVLLVPYTVLGYFLNKVFVFRPTK